MSDRPCESSGVSDSYDYSEEYSVTPSTSETSTQREESTNAFASNRYGTPETEESEANATTEVSVTGMADVEANVPARKNLSLCGSAAARITWASICVFLFVFIVILVAVLLAESHVELGQNLYGLQYGHYNRKVGTRVYTANAKYWLGVSDTFLVFPSTPINLDSEINCFTADRVSVDLSLSYQYSIARDHVRELLFFFGGQDAVHRFISLQTRDSIRDVCGNFTYEQFYGNRALIESSLRAKTVTDIESLDFGFEVGALQLTNVHIPEELGAAIQDKEDAAQRVVNARNQRAQILIAADTELKRATEDGRIRVINAEAQGEADIYAANQNANAIIIEATEAATADEAELLERGVAFEEIAKQAGNTTDTLSILSTLQYLVNINES